LCIAQIPSGRVNPYLSHLMAALLQLFTIYVYSIEIPPKVLKILMICHIWRLKIPCLSIWQVPCI